MYVFRPGREKIDLEVDLKTSNGQILLETCLIIPVLLLFVFLIIQISLIFNSYLVVNYAAFSAARAGVSHFNNLPDSNPYNAAKDAARIVLLPLSPVSALVANVKVNKQGNEVYVKIKYPMPLIFNVRRFLPYAMLIATCRMPIK